MPDPAPLILTLTLDDPAQERIDALRRTHFPPDRNVLAAHVTAFHALPGERLDDVVADVRASAPGGPVAVAVTGVRFLGRGVALDLAAPRAEAVRADLADRWHPSLGGQDRQRWRPHVTVQNKVAPEVARALHAELSAAFVPHAVEAVGWSLFRYRGGPWEHVLDVPFGRDEFRSARQSFGGDARHDAGRTDDGKESAMATFVTIGYGDAAGYDRTDPAVRDAAHAHDDELRRRGVVMGTAGPPVQVRNHDAAGVTAQDGPFMATTLPVAGFALVEAETLAEAVELVSRTPCAVAQGVVEVWPLLGSP